MDLEAELELAEGLLEHEVTLLGAYNRLLERHSPCELAELLAHFRDDGVRRIESLQQRIRSYHARLEVS